MSLLLLCKYQLNSSGKEQKAEEVMEKEGVNEGLGVGKRANRGTAEHSGC